MLSKAEKDYLITLIDKGESIPEDFRYKLFPVEHKEYELAYAGKMRKEDLLANDDGSFPVPLQIEKVFNGSEHPAHADGWRNMIVFGDNLQFLKTIYKNDDPMIKDRVKNKVKLIYIDPPFATSDEFQSKEGAKAYSDKKEGAEFIEYLRKRIILAHSILADDGSIFVHLDWKMAHYIKIVLDEVFGKNNLRNEIVWAYNGPGSPGMKQFNRKHDTIFWYSKSFKWTFNDDDIRVEHSEKTMDNFKAGLEGSGFTSDTYELNKGGKIPEDWWQIAVASRIKIDGFNRMGYPTEKPVKLIERIIRACSNEEDIVLDFFAGSGVVASVAERLNRKWISCDIGKLSYYTVQRRILEISKSKSLSNNQKKYNKPAKAFVTCSLGAYDLKNALSLEFNKYKEFVSGLFDVDLGEQKIGGYLFDGKKDGNPVIIFDYNTHKDSNVDDVFINNIAQHIGNRMSGGRIYIVAPSNRVDYITDYEEINSTRYYFLKIPYQIIKELHLKDFKKFRQPRSRNDVNALDESIGFSFNRTPSVKSAICTSNSKLVITISDFTSEEPRSGKTSEEKKLSGFELLSAIFIDRSYNGKEFIMTDALFSDDIKIEGNKATIELDLSSVGEKIMIVYTDIFGNDLTESFSLGGD